MVTIIPLETSTESLLGAHRATYPTLPLPQNFRLVVTTQDIVFVFYIGDHPALTDCSEMCLDGHEDPVRCVASTWIDHTWEELAIFCEQKVSWYCGVIGQPRQQAQLVAT